MNRSPLDKQRLTGEAIEWLARLNGQKVGNATRGHFILWLMRSYTHVEAFLAAARVYGEVGFVKALPSVQDLAAQGRAEPRNSNVVRLHGTGEPRMDAPHFEEERRVSHSIIKYAVAATIVVAFIAVGLLTYQHAERPTLVHTHVGEQRSVVLDDGTAVYLNTDTFISASLSSMDRRIELTHGEARFTVAKDPKRPFYVTTPQAVVRAVGTAFNVRIIDQRTVISVIEGHIRVVKRAGNTDSQESPDVMELFANQQVEVSRAGTMVDNGGPPFDRAMGWTQRRIVFHDEPLSVLVTEFNRYSEKPLEIADPELAQHKIDGGFDVFDRASLLDYLRRYQGVRIDEEDGKLLMRRATAPPPGH
jgi:transmembrane sensor